MLSDEKKKDKEEKVIRLIENLYLANPSEKLVISELAQKLPVSRSYLYRSKRICETIEKLNKPEPLDMGERGQLPNVYEILKMCGDDIEKYKEVVDSLMSIVENQKKIIEKMKKESVLTNTDMKKTIEEKDKMIKKLNKMLNYNILNSPELIDLNIKENIKKMDPDTFEEQFKDLFEVGIND